MKKLIIITGSIVAGIILMGIMLYGMFSILFKYSPEKELNRQIISLANFDYTIGSVEELDEEWYSLSSCYTVLEFNELTQDNINYLKSCNPLPLPISETEYRQMMPEKIPNPFKNPNSSYYIYMDGRIPDLKKFVTMQGRPFDFKIFIVDVEKKLAILYRSGWS